MLRSTAFMRLFAALLTAAPVLTVVRCGADGLTPQMREEDPRLARTVTVDSRRIYVEDLLARLSERTGVKLSADQGEGASDEQIALKAGDVKLADLLDGLWSLFSYEGGAWRWERLGEAGRYRYVLHRPATARSMAARLREYGQKLFEEQTETLLRFAGMSPQERKRKTKELSKALLQEDDRLAIAYLADDRTWSALQIFGDVTSPAERKSVARGELHKTVAVSGLSQSARQFVHSAWLAGEWRRKKPNGEWEPVPEPNKLTIHASHSEGTTAPSLFVDLEGIGGYGYSGGTPLDAYLKERLRKLWMQPGDETDSPIMAHRVAAPAKAERPRPVRRLGERLRELGYAAPLSFMARLPRQQRDPGAPFESTVGAFLGRLLEQPPHAYAKWRNGLLLVDHPGWYLPESPTVPWKIATALREAAGRDNGFLSLEQLSSAAGSLTADQLRILSEDLPVLDFAVSCYPLLHAMGQSPLTARAVVSEKGVPLTEDVLTFFRENGRLPLHVEQNRPTSLRLTQKEIELAGKRMREYTFEFAGQDGNWMPASGYRAHPVDEGE